MFRNEKDAKLYGSFTVYEICIMTGNVFICSIENDKLAAVHIDVKYLCEQRGFYHFQLNSQSPRYTDLNYFYY